MLPTSATSGRAIPSSTNAIAPSASMVAMAANTMVIRRALP